MLTDGLEVWLKINGACNVKMASWPWKIEDEYILLVWKEMEYAEEPKKKEMKAVKM